MFIYCCERDVVGVVGLCLGYRPPSHLGGSCVASLQGTQKKYQRGEVDNEEMAEKVDKGTEEGKGRIGRSVELGQVK